MADFAAGAICVAICFWPAAMAAGLGWWLERRRRSVQPQDDGTPVNGTPGYLVVTGLLAALGAVAVAGFVSALFTLG